MTGCGVGATNHIGGWHTVGGHIRGGHASPQGCIGKNTGPVLHIIIGTGAGIGRGGGGRGMAGLAAASDLAPASACSFAFLA